MSWSGIARPPMGPRIATPVAASDTRVRFGHGRLYPIGDRAPRTSNDEHENKNALPKMKQVLPMS